MKTKLFAVAVMLFAVPAAGSQAAMDRLMGCMKMPAASKEQEACLAEVKQLQATAPKSAAAAAPKPKSKSAGAPPPPVPQEVKAAAAEVHLNGMQPKGSTVGGISPLAVRDLSGMDLETAMMTIQAQRANLLEAQLRTQLEAIQTRNQQIAKMNQLLTDVKAKRPAGNDPLKFANLGASQAEGRAMVDRLRAAGLTMPSGADAVDEAGSGIYDARQKTYDAWAQELKGRIEALNSSQQIEMLRIQSLTNKRNEAFDLMTNFIKKMQDSRASIVGNMR